MKAFAETFTVNSANAALAKGQKISDVQQRLQGITCGPKNTSCPDQFAQLLKAIQ